MDQKPKKHIKVQRRPCNQRCQAPKKSQGEAESREIEMPAAKAENQREVNQKPCKETSVP